MSQVHRRSAWLDFGIDRLCGCTTEPANSAAPEKASSGPASVNTFAVAPGAGPAACSANPMASANSGDWSTHVVERRCRIGASRRIRCTQMAFWAVVAVLASTAIMAPAAPANAVATGTTQNPLLVPTAQDSSAAWPALRSPRVMTDAASRVHRLPARTRGPTTWPSAVSRQAATSESVAEVRRIWIRSTTGQACWTRVPPLDAPQPTSPPTTKHRRLSTG